jgi:hypothetical protein
MVVLRLGAERDQRGWLVNPPAAVADRPTAPGVPPQSDLPRRRMAPALPVRDGGTAPGPGNAGRSPWPDQHGGPAPNLALRPDGRRRCCSDPGRLPGAANPTRSQPASEVVGCPSSPTPSLLVDRSMLIGGYPLHGGGKLLQTEPNTHFTGCGGAGRRVSTTSGIMD